MSGAALLAAQGPLQWQPHVEIWLLLAAVVALGFYVTRVIQPTMLAAGEASITRRQKGFFVAGVVVLGLASDWPVHDLAEEYLFSIHMVQHLVLTLVMPPLFLLATPAWLVKLVFGAGRVGALLQTVGRPLFAGLLYNGLVVLTHAAPLVNASVKIGPLHYLLHSALVLSALLMWNPVCGPVHELRLSLPTQMAYLFGMSVLPTIPAAFLTVAENPLYRAYERGDYRLWGVNVVQDQQSAGLIMKLGGGFYLWSIIIVLFVRWSSRHQVEARGTPVKVLTYEGVTARFEASVPATSDTTP
ncbi:MAG: cytochrome c oxidase assembly protein [Acidimicrobiales bacterium]